MEACLVRNRPYSPGVEPELQDVEGQELLVLREILGRYPRGREAIVPILQDITAEFNWLPEWSLRMVAHTLGLPLSRVVRVATFYNLFSLEPRGKHIIRVCTGTACHVKGAGKIVDSLERELKVKSGETTDDRRFTLEAVRCLGCCGLAPVVTIDEEVYGKITSARLVKELDAYPA
ncbi:MAG: NADH-quinone oxidoreductase subunit NuoE [Deltaproteobacteria bacterium]|nr:NADH-quinone oxidoreductase subunit NuoE [Deltaproteobacteria bacterium]